MESILWGFDNDPTSKRTLIDQVKTRILASQVGNSYISNIYIIPSGDLQMISTKNKGAEGHLPGVHG